MAVHVARCTYVAMSEPFLYQLHLHSVCKEQTGTAVSNNTRQAMVHTGLQLSVRNDKVRENKMLLGYYDYTVILTYMGMLSAFAGILSAVNCNFKAALICLI